MCSLSEPFFPVDALGKIQIPFPDNDLRFGGPAVRDNVGFGGGAVNFVHRSQYVRFIP